ncbi:hypothetical protein ACHAPV_009041, partial [Trichoderma viride]
LFAQPYSTTLVAASQKPSKSTFRIGFPGGSAGEGASGRSAVLDAATIPIEGEATQAEATLIQMQFSIHLQSPDVSDV